MNLTDKQIQELEEQGYSDYQIEYIQKPPKERQLIQCENCGGEITEEQSKEIEQREEELGVIVFMDMSNYCCSTCRAAGEI